MNKDAVIESIRNIESNFSNIRIDLMNYNSSEAYIKLLRCLNCLTNLLSRLAEEPTVRH